MAPKSQPRGARGTVGHPYSALNLRLALAMVVVAGLSASGVSLMWGA